MGNGMFNDVINMAEMMNAATQFSSETKQIYNVWKNVVSKIKTSRDSEDCETRMPIGERLAGNTRVVDLKKGILLVETDHSGWIQYLRIYEKFIIKGLNMALPEMKINSLAFKVKGTNANLSESYEKRLSDEKEKYNKKLEETEKALDSYNKDKEEKNKTENQAELPQELLEKFNSIRKSIMDSK